MAGLVHGVAVVEEIATAGCGGVNAAYFASRAWRTRGTRRAAATVLATLFAGSALAAGQPHEPGLADIALHASLLAANVGTLLLIWLGAGR